MRGDGPVLEPWRETAYAQLMRRLPASGQRSAALKPAMPAGASRSRAGLEPSPGRAVRAGAGW
ncbi:MAG: hypothetical protein IPO81_28060 [Kouleothrix sp.]|nr:hypothetical protein [Kouleothrix sp.]